MLGELGVVHRLLYVRQGNKGKFRVVIVFGKRS
jgi:hypothetical protein